MCVMRAHTVSGQTTKRWLVCVTTAVTPDYDYDYGYYVHPVAMANCHPQIQLFRTDIKSAEPFKTKSLKFSF